MESNDPSIPDTTPFMVKSEAGAQFLLPWELPETEAEINGLVLAIDYLEEEIARARLQLFLGKMLSEWPAAREMIAWKRHPNPNPDCELPWIFTSRPADRLRDELVAAAGYNPTEDGGGFYTLLREKWPEGTWKNREQVIALSQSLVPGHVHARNAARALADALPSAPATAAPRLRP